MSIVECTICGKGVKTTASNYIYANGIHQHKKCTKKPTLSDEEISDYRDLRLAIEWAFNKKRFDNKYGLNWTLVTNQIKHMREMGYSYKDQLYALKYLVELDGGYWGYGRVEKFITSAMEVKNREELFRKKNEEVKPEIRQELRVTSKSNLLDF